MAGTTSIQTPVYAVVGAGDLAVEKLREVRLPKADVKAAQAKVKAAQDKMKAVPGRAQAAYQDALTQAGEAVAWPPNEVHAAWTDGTQMRAIVVEFEGPTLALPGAVEGDLVRVEPGRRAVTKGEGKLAERTGPPQRRPEDEIEGEPL